ncbi:hypothetical protein [Bowmanella dokdonensis]|uniref:Uncharacterized protein n=1 Tax=Bowmanella dokdonensis TaxID=751969 RepID=A0A939IQQ2_9ALTE|nr:hypothetical protein [Bowmanella dokdonensis]MBN7827175.1 hypothetical protein [Bowmanella dokdonensis]
MSSFPHACTRLMDMKDAATTGQPEVIAWTEDGEVHPADLAAPGRISV